MIGLIAVTAAGQAAAARLARAWPGETRSYDGPAAAALPRAWAECDALVCFLATGATIRLLAPLLASKHTDPAVVCVDEAGRHAIALLGGHGSRAGTPPGGNGGAPAGGDSGTPPGGNGGANALAVRVADVLDAEPVLSTATDLAGLPGLDTLGWPVEGAVAAVSRAMLDGEPVRLDSSATWPLPAFPPNVRVSPSPAGDPGQGNRILVTDEMAPADGRTVVLRPPSLAVGVGASRGVSAAEVLSLIDTVLDEAGLSPLSVAALATADAKAASQGSSRRRPGAAGRWSATRPRSWPPSPCRTPAPRPWPQWAPPAWPRRPR